MDKASEIEMIIDKILPWCSSREEAEKWCSTIVIPSLGRTANDMVLLGKYKIVLAEIERMSIGGFA